MREVEWINSGEAGGCPGLVCERRLGIGWGEAGQVVREEKKKRDETSF